MPASLMKSAKTPSDLMGLSLAGMNPCPVPPEVAEAALFFTNRGDLDASPRPCYITDIHSEKVVSGVVFSNEIDDQKRLGLIRKVYMAKFVQPFEPIPTVGTPYFSHRPEFFLERTKDREWEKVVETKHGHRIRWKEEVVRGSSEPEYAGYFIFPSKDVHAFQLKRRPEGWHGFRTDGTSVRIKLPDAPYGSIEEGFERALRWSEENDPMVIELAKEGDE